MDLNNKGSMLPTKVPQMHMEATDKPTTMAKRGKLIGSLGKVQLAGKW